MATKMSASEDSIRLKSAAWLPIIRGLMSNRQSQLGILIVLIWCLIILFGFAKLVIYSQAAGADGVTARQVSLRHSLPENGNDWQLLVGIHPKCSCTNATLVELERLLRSTGSNLTCTVLVYAPQQETADWINTSLVHAAQQIPGVKVEFDRDGESMAAQGILTSGGVILFDKSGTSRFHGGITQSRGHEGDNQGAESIRAIVEEGEPTTLSTPTYGCLIRTARESIQ